MNAGGLVEMHAHILPGMDDGSKSVEMSIEMLHRLAEMGVAEVCATSHYYAGQNSVTMYLERRAMALEQLREAVGAQDDLPASSSCRGRLLPGRGRASPGAALHREHPDPDAGDAFSEWTDQQTEAVTVLALDLHFNVVLVHPERFCFSSNNRRRLKELASLPIALQVNADTLLHWRSRKQGLELLELTSTPLLGSDCHNTTSRPPNLKGGREMVLRKLGEKFLDRMDENAGCWTVASSRDRVKYRQKKRFAKKMP